MNTKYKITEEQRSIIDTLRCCRLDDSERILRNVSTFDNTRNPKLAFNLQNNDAFDENRDGHIAYYIILNERDEIIFYFSIKCGSLYDTLYNEETYKLLRQLLVRLESIELPSFSAEQREALINIKEKIRAHKSLTKKDIADLHIENDPMVSSLEERLPQDNSANAYNTFSGVEIVHFCANDNPSCREWWKALNMPRSLGHIVFYKFIVPLITDSIQPLIGCQYTYLFAADSTRDGTLISYYENRLGFICTEDRKTIKPMYDNGCRFMLQEVKNMKVNADMFWQNFNLKLV